MLLRRCSWRRSLGREVLLLPWLSIRDSSISRGICIGSRNKFGVFGCGPRVGWNRGGHDESCPNTERNARSGRGKPRLYSRRNTKSGHGVPCPYKSSRGRENQIPCCARNDNAEKFA